MLPISGQNGLLQLQNCLAVHEPRLIHTMYLAELRETQQRRNHGGGNAFFRA